MFSDFPIASKAFERKDSPGCSHPLNTMACYSNTMDHHSTIKKTELLIIQRYVEQKTPDINNFVLYESFPMKFKNRQSVVIESRTIVTCRKW